MSLDSPNEFPQYSLKTSPILTLNYLKSIPNYPLFKTFSFWQPGYNLLYSKTGNPPPRTFSTKSLEENFVDLGRLVNLNMDKLIPLLDKREKEHGPWEVPAKLLYLLWGDDDARPLTKLINEDIKNGLPEFFTGAYQQDAMDITIKFTKLTIYQSGESSPIHRELPRSPEHCGRLLITWPHNYTGGELVIYDNFGQKNIVKDICIAMYTEVSHEVMKVTSGYRITLEADIEVKKKELGHSINFRDFNFFENLTEHAKNTVPRLCEQCLDLAGNVEEFGILLRFDYKEGLREEVLRGMDKEMYRYFEMRGYKLRLCPVVAQGVKNSVKFYEFPSSLLNADEEFCEDDYARCREEVKEEGSIKLTVKNQNPREIRMPLIMFTPKMKMIRLGGVNSLKQYSYFKMALIIKKNSY